MLAGVDSAFGGLNAGQLFLFLQRRPLPLDSLIFNLSELSIGNAEFLANHLLRPWHVANDILGRYQITEDFTSLFDGKTLRHGRKPSSLCIPCLPRVARGRL